MSDLKRYKAVVNGTETILLLNAADADALGDAVTLWKKPRVKQAAANAEVGDADNKTGEPSADKAAESGADKTGAPSGDKTGAPVGDKSAGTPATK